jgi:hypothetical protein
MDEKAEEREMAEEIADKVTSLARCRWLDPEGANFR